MIALLILGKKLGLSPKGDNPKISVNENNQLYFRQSHFS